MALIYDITKEKMLDRASESSDGLFRVQLWSDNVPTSGASVGALSELAWADASGETKHLSSETVITITVSGSPITIGGMYIYWWDGSATTIAMFYAFSETYTYNNTGTFTINDIELELT